MAQKLPVLRAGKNELIGHLPVVKMRISQKLRGPIVEFS